MVLRVSGLHGRLQVSGAPVVLTGQVLVLILVLGAAWACWVRGNWSTWRWLAGQCGGRKERCPRRRLQRRGEGEDVKLGYHGRSDHRISKRGAYGLSGHVRRSIKSQMDGDSRHRHVRDSSENDVDEWSSGSNGVCV